MRRTTEEIMELVEECNNWQPDYKFACIDKTKFKEALDS